MGNTDYTIVMRPRGKRREPTRGGIESGAALIYGWHSALAALRNPRRRIRKLLATPNALQRLSDLGGGASFHENLVQVAASAP